MFSLEQSIADWRKQMLAAGLQSPVPLDELESHLREEIERQVESGLSEQKAFEISAQQTGRPKTLEREFKKIESNIMKRIAIVALGIFGILFGPGLILPALAKHKNLGIWNYDIVWPIVLGTIITLAGIGTALFVLRKRKA